MAKSARHIYPVVQVHQRRDREQLLKQRAVVVWLTGLSGSGKSAIARELEQRLHRKGHLTKLLDGDNVRAGINKNLGFTEADRQENIRRIAEVAKLFLDCGVIVLCSFVSPMNAYRALARNIIGSKDFIETYVNCPLEVCEKRDVKGLYKKARAGQIRDFTGIDAPYEPPDNPEVELRTDSMQLQESVQVIYEYMLPRVAYKD